LNHETKSTLSGTIVKSIKLSSCHASSFFNGIKGILTEPGSIYKEAKILKVIKVVCNTDLVSCSSVCDDRINIIRTGLCILSRVINLVANIASNVFSGEYLFQ